MAFLTLSSSDAPVLLSGMETQGYRKLLRKFSGELQPEYNSLASPIDALRTGSIIEQRYLLSTPINYFSQYFAQSKEMDVFTAHIDFAIMEGGKIVDHEEVKSVEFSDFIKLKSVDDPEPYILKSYKNNYIQLQQQLICTGNDSGQLVFICVHSYDDAENYSRIIVDKDIVRFRINRNEEMIDNLMRRARPFQYFRDWHLKSPALASQAMEDHLKCCDHTLTSMTTQKSVKSKKTAKNENIK